MQRQSSYFEARYAVVEVAAVCIPGGRRCIPGRSYRSISNPGFYCCKGRMRARVHQQPAIFDHWAALALQIICRGYVRIWHRNRLLSSRNDTTTAPEQWNGLLSVTIEQNRSIWARAFDGSRTQNATCKPLPSRSSTKGPSTPVRIPWRPPNDVVVLTNSLHRRSEIFVYIEAHATSYCRTCLPCSENFSLIVVSIKRMLWN